MAPAYTIAGNSAFAQTFWLLITYLIMHSLSLLSLTICIYWSHNILYGKAMKLLLHPMLMILIELKYFLCSSAASNRYVTYIRTFFF